MQGFRFQCRGLLLLLVILGVQGASGQTLSQAFSVDGCPNAVCQGRGPFSRADSLRGQLTPLRTCYNVLFYDLEVEVDILGQSIKGRNRIVADALQWLSRLQIDLMPFMEIDSIRTSEGGICAFTREAGAVFVSFPEPYARDAKIDFWVYYHGKPRVALRPPWDGGFVWARDRQGKPWVGVACEGFGASSWWPLKDHLSDEPDSARIAIIVPDTLTAVSNGTLRSQTPQPNNRMKWEWFVHYPINSYNVTLNIADYIRISDSLQGELGNLPIDYYVLRPNEAKARDHFRQVKPMLRCFEKHFGPYPFYRDGYALVEAPYWGMEHQGAIAYGNNFSNNPQGFDFIIVHETGHEWFGNNISMADHADMWLHEAFTTYAEFIYLECTRGYALAVQYLNTQRTGIKNQNAIQGPRGVNFEHETSDMYNKGSWMLHTLRNVLKDDARWFRMLRGTWDRFRLQTIATEQMVAYINQALGVDYNYFFKQYLTRKEVPVLEWDIKQKGRRGYWLSFRWADVGEDFVMPIDYKNRNGTLTRLNPTPKIQRIFVQDLTSDAELPIDSSSYYVFLRRVPNLRPAR